jgi:hypothetical protein
MALDRNQLKAPVLPKEAVPVDALGGEVIVRGLLLSERLALSALNSQLSQPLDGEDKALANARAGAQMVAHTLAKVVLLADGLPVYSAAEWDAFGAAQSGVVLDLYRHSRRLNGLDAGDIEKN